MKSPLSATARLRPVHILAASIAGTLLASAAISATITLTASDPINISSFDTAGSWSNGSAPSAGNDYFTGAFQLRTPINPMTAVFAGDSLSIDAGGSLGFKTSGVITVNNLLLNGGTLIQSLTGGTPEEGKLDGVLTVTADSVIDTTSAAGRILTINSLIRGSSGLRVQGTGGTVNFTNVNNDYTGTITLGGATGRTTALVVPTVANVGTPSGLGAGGSSASQLTFEGGTLRITGAAGSTDRLFTLTTFGGAIESSGTAPLAFTNSAPIALSGSGTRTLTLGGTNTAANLFAPVIGDNGGATSVTKAGASLWTLSGANTFTGTLSITGGTLEFSSLANLGDPAAPISIGTATLRWAAGNAANLAGRAVTFTGGAATLNTNGSDVTITSNITGAGGLTKAGGGVLTLSGVNTFTGGVSVGNNGGGVRITNSDSLGRGTKTVSVNGNLGVVNSPNLRLNAASGRIDLPALISFTSSADGNNGAGSTPGFINEAGDNTIGGNFTLTSGGGGTRFRVDAGSLALNGNFTPNTSGRVLFLSGVGGGAINGQLLNQSATNVLALTKEGAGTWMLNGANAYTAATTVSAGELRTTTASTGGGGVTVADSAAFGVRVAAAGQTLAASNLTLNGATSRLAFDLGALGNPTVPVITAAAFNPNGTVAVTFNGTNLVPGSFPLVDYGTLGGAGIGALNLVLPPRATGSLAENPATTSVDLTIATIDYPRWTGAVSNAWDISTQNWRELNGGNATGYIEGTPGGSDAVLFDNAAGVVTTTVNLPATLTPAAVVVNNPTQEYTFTGVGKLSGTTGLTKRGAGTLILANTGGNDYLGATQIDAGAIQLGDGATLGAGQFGLGPVVNEGAIIVNRPDPFTLANLISGNGGLIKNGAGTLTLTANNRFAGDVRVNAGVLRVGAATALGTSVGNTVVGGGGTLDIAGTNLGAESVRIAGTGVGGVGALVNNAADQTQALRFLTLTEPAAIGGTNRIDLRANGGGETLDLAGFKLTKIGSGRFGIVGATVTDGDIDVAAGILGIEAASIVQGNGTITYAAGTTALFNGTTAANITRPMAWNGNVVDSAGVTGGISSPVALGGNVNVSTSANTLTLGGPISGAGFGFNKLGAGILELAGSAANSFTGVTTVSAGTLRLAKTGAVAIAGDVVVNGGALAMSSVGQFGPDASVTINQGGAWASGNFLQEFKNLTINTNILQSVNNVNLSGTLSFTVGLHDINSSQSLNTNALSISGGANFRLGANSGATTVNIGSGGLNLANGTLQLGQAGGAVTAAVNLGGDLIASGTSAITNPNTAGPRLLDLLGVARSFNVVDGTTTISPAIQNGGITKTGAGALNLTGASAYIGATLVNDGTLIVSGSISGSTVTVGANGTLGGTGMITGNVAINGALQPGGTPGTLTLGATDLTLGSGATSTFQLAGNAAFDRVVGINHFTLDGTMNVTLFGGYAPAFGDTFDLLDFASVDASGFNAATDLALPALGGGLAWDTGGFVTAGVLTVVPEPGSATLLLTGFLAFAGLRRFRRS